MSSWWEHSILQGLWKIWKISFDIPSHPEQGNPDLLASNGFFSITSAGLSLSLSLSLSLHPAFLGLAAAVQSSAIGAVWSALPLSPCGGEALNIAGRSFSSAKILREFKTKSRARLVQLELGVRGSWVVDHGGLCCRHSAE